MLHPFEAPDQSIKLILCKCNASAAAQIQFIRTELSSAIKQSRGGNAEIHVKAAH